MRKPQTFRKLVAWIGIGASSSACGGKSLVDLGNNADGSSGWADTAASQPTATTAPQTTSKLPDPASVETLYAGQDFVRTIAVDETSIAAVMQEPGTSNLRIELCEFADCRGTRRVIYTLPAPPNEHGMIGFPGGIGQLLLSEGEVIWVVNDWSSDQHWLLACPLEGCPEGPRRVASVKEVTSNLVASGTHIFWCQSSILRRCTRSDNSEPEQLENAPGPYWYTDNPDASHLVLDDPNATLYLVGKDQMRNDVIARLPSDFSAKPTLFHQDSVRLRGLALVSEKVYFARSILAGQIVTCPVTGCEQGPTELVSAPNWPQALVADQGGMIWLREEPNNMLDYDGAGFSILAARLDGSGIIELYRRARTTNGYALGAYGSHVSVETGGIALNSHHFYWLEAVDSPFGSVIKMVKR